MGISSVTDQKPVPRNTTGLAMPPVDWRTITGPEPRQQHHGWHLKSMIHEQCAACRALLLEREED